MLTILLAMLEDEEDQRKFLKLHTAYEQKLYRIALKILRSHELAEDAVQQSWVQVIQHFEKVKQVPWGAVDGYLVVIVKNVSMTILESLMTRKSLNYQILKLLIYRIAIL